MGKAKAKQTDDSQLEVRMGGGEICLYLQVSNEPKGSIPKRPNRKPFKTFPNN